VPKPSSASKKLTPATSKQAPAKKKKRVAKPVMLNNFFPALEGEPKFPVQD